MCRESSEPIYITKNGYGDMVIMSMRLYEENYCKPETYRKLDETKENIKEGKTYDAVDSLVKLRNKLSHQEICTDESLTTYSNRRHFKNA